MKQKKNTNNNESQKLNLAPYPMQMNCVDLTNIEYIEYIHWSLESTRK